MNILQEADGITGGARNKTYGNPAQNHARTAALWTEYMRGKYGGMEWSGAGWFEMDADDVCYMNILQKVSRAMCDSEHRDTWVDIAGYARNLEMIREGQ